MIVFVSRVHRESGYKWLQFDAECYLKSNLYFVSYAKASYMAGVHARKNCDQSESVIKFYLRQRV